MSIPTLQVVAVTKSFKAHRAVKGLSLTIDRGEVYALLGPNGAGKTTTLNMILGFLEADEGEILVDGRSVADSPLEARARIAYLPETVSLYPALTGIENLRYFALLAGRKLDDRICRELLLAAGLQEEAHARRAAQYSKGMRQKVGVAIARAKRATLLLLDEPTSGLDPSASVEFYLMLRELAGAGLAVLMATHDLWRVDQAATRIGILRSGVLTDEIDPRDTNAAALQDIYVRRLAA
jgi:ABC-2 type transport system ATP-binding protein